MRIFLINLARRPDRLAAMTAQLRNRLDLAFARIDAVDAARMTDGEVASRFASGGPLGAIPKGDKCCTLSHILAWEAFLHTGEDYGVILEDDVALAPGAGALLRETAWIPPDTALLKLEHYGPAGQRILVSDPVEAGSFRIARLCSRHTGAGAYVISRATAELLLGIEKWTLPIDHMLFNPNNSPIFAKLRPGQLIPTIARQALGDGARSDIEDWRKPLRRLGWTYVKRELVRFGYELRLLPRQFLSLLSGKAKLVRVGTDT